MPTGISGLYKNTKGAAASPKIHDVKIFPEYFDAVESGIKPFEIRYNDRDYKIGDILCLKEFCDGNYTGRETVREICYMIDDPEFCKAGYVVLGLKQSATDTNDGRKNERAQIKDIKVFVKRLKKRLYVNPTIFTQQRYIVNSEIDDLVEEIKGSAG